jgi:hypothetical protein
LDPLQNSVECIPSAKYSKIRKSEPIKLNKIISDKTLDLDIYKNSSDYLKDMIKNIISPPLDEERSLEYPNFNNISFLCLGPNVTRICTQLYAN